MSELSCLVKRRILLFLDSATSLEQYFSGIYVRFDSELLVALLSNGYSAASLSLVYRTERYAALQFHRIADWSYIAGFTWLGGSSWKPKNLQGIPIKAAFIPIHGYRDLIYVSEKNVWRLTGYDGEIMYELQYRLNFTTTFSIPEDRQYGIPKENGTWNGMVQKVATNQVTIGIGPFDYTDDRLDVVSYLPPIWNYKVTVYIRQPDIVMSTLQQILSPFSLEVWLVIMTIVVSLIASLASIWRLYSTHFSTRDDNAFNIQEYTTHVLGIFLLQGHGATLRILSWRLVYFVMYFLSTVLFIAYSAKFISNLSVRRPSLPFTDFEGLLEDGSYKIRLLAGNVYGKYLQESKESTLRQIYKQMIAPHVRDTGGEPLDNIQSLCSTPKTGYITTDRMVRIISGKMACTVLGLRDSYFPITASLIISKDSPFRRLFSNQIQALRRTGILKRMNDNTFPIKMTEVIKEPPSSVALDTVAIFFSILGTGILISMLIFAAEVAFQKRYGNNQRLH
ncbi:glutamate receptor-like [Periplaneta americana]|uniref:glutamate receptor-like n=1 Tax=Periplaneta americana TaxID=6978 RepID=UPI0037E85DDB